MTTLLQGVQVSPVNMDDRKKLGIRAGDTVRVHVKIEERGKTRTQVFEGLVLARKHGNEPGATFTVRKVVDGIGVEKIFPLYSPQIDKIEVLRRSKVRRAKLYYIREKVAREIKRQMRKMHLMGVATESGIEAAARAEEAKAVEDNSPEEAKAPAEAAEAPAEEQPIEIAEEPKQEEGTATEEEKKE